jgi:hypothetical protein
MEHTVRRRVQGGFPLKALLEALLKALLKALYGAPKLY